MLGKNLAKHGKVLLGPVFVVTAHEYDMLPLARAFLTLVVDGKVVISVGREKAQDERCAGGDRELDSIHMLLGVLYGHRLHTLTLVARFQSSDPHAESSEHGPHRFRKAEKADSRRIRGVSLSVPAGC